MHQPYWTYLFKELTRRKARLITSLLAVAILVSIFVITTSVLNAYAQAVYLPFKNIGADIIVQKSASRTADNISNVVQLPFGKGIFEKDTVDKIGELPHITDATGALIIWRYNKGSFITIEGFDPASFIGTKYGSWVASGRTLQPGERNKAVVEKHFAKFYGLKSGDSLQLGDATFNIIGTIAASDESQVAATNVYINLADAQALLGKQGYSQIYVKLDSLAAERDIRNEINGMDKNAITMSSNTIAASLSNYIDIYEKYQTLVLVIIGIILALILFQVNATALAERRKDIGILQTIGWTKTNISTQIIGEVLIQTIMGFILGILISGLIIIAVGSISIQTKISQGLGNDLTTLGSPLQLSLPAAGEFLALTLIIAIVLSWVLSIKLAAMKPAANLKTT